MIFNVGARRSGTYWLQQIVCAHPAVAEVPSETYFFSDGVRPLLERLQYEDPSRTEMATVFARRERIIPAVRDLCDVLFGEFLQHGQTHVAERTPWHVVHMPLIAEIYPDARFVHIIRDGRDVARSIVPQPWPPHTLAEAAEEWRRSVEAGRAAAELLGEQLLEVRYEDLLSQPRPVIERIYAHLGLAGGVDAGVAAAAKEVNVGPQDYRVGAGKWRDAWSRRERRTFERVAGDLVRELGYDQGAGVSAG